MKKFCPKCYAKLPYEHVYCPFCGYRIPEVKKKDSMFLNGRIFLVLIPFILIIGLIIIYFA